MCHWHLSLIFQSVFLSTKYLNLAEASIGGVL